MARPPKLLLVDINVLGFWSMRQSAYLGLSAGNLPTGAIHGTLDKLFELLDVWADHAPIVLWDDRCGWREQILPEYKRHRWATPAQQALLKSYLRQAAVVRELLMHLALPQLFCQGFEADDLAGVIVRESDPSWPIVLATTDTDWLQAIRENVTWVSPASGACLTLEDLRDPTKVKGGPFDSTDHYISAKALAGDTSDGIPGVQGVGLTTAGKIIREYGSVESLWAEYDAGKVVKGRVWQRAAMPENREVYRRNLRLIDWRLAPSRPTINELHMEAANPKEYRRICQALQLRRDLHEPRRVARPADECIIKFGHTLSPLQ